MSILEDRLKRDQTEKRIIDAKVSNLDMRPTKAETEMSQQVISEVSLKFCDDIANYGFTPGVVAKIKQDISERCAELDTDYESKKKIERLAVANVTGLGPIQPYIDDETVTEIIVQRFDNICVERHGLIEPVGAAFMSEAQLVTIINRIIQPVGRQLNLHTPMVDARLADGSRINATIPPATPDGATLTIRKFSKTAMTGKDYLTLNSMDQNMLEFLSDCVRDKISIIVSGGTTAGKTTMLNMLSSYIPKDELIVTIEDDCELQLEQPNVRRMEAQSVQSSDPNAMPITIQALVKNALRMRPDRIIVGEIRDKTIVDMMSAMSTGHEGSMCTVHASSPRSLIDVRMPILYKMTGSDSFSETAQALQISEAIKIIVQLARTRNGDRVVTHITHVAGLDENGKIILNDIFRYNETENTFYATGYIPEEILNIFSKHGTYFDTEKFTYRQR